MWSRLIDTGNETADLRPTVPKVPSVGACHACSPLPQSAFKRLDGILLVLHRRAFRRQGGLTAAPLVPLPALFLTRAKKGPQVRKDSGAPSPGASCCRFPHRSGQHHLSVLVVCDPFVGDVWHYVSTGTLVVVCLLFVCCLLFVYCLLAVWF